MRFTIKISTASYLPLVGISLPFFNNFATAVHTAKRSIRSGAMWGEDKNSVLNDPVMVGEVRLVIPNPMYDLIQTRLNVLRSPPPYDYNGSNGRVRCNSTEKRRPPPATTPPTPIPSAAAFAKAREYNDEKEDNMVEDECAGLVEGRRHASASNGTAPGRTGKVKTGCFGEGEHYLYW